MTVPTLKLHNLKQKPPRSNFETSPSCKTIGNGNPNTATRSFPKSFSSTMMVTMKFEKIHQSFKKRGNYPTISPSSLPFSIDPNCFNRSKKFLLPSLRHRL
ncbi:hypothetical protein P8452_22652 [Trifolium repens]|nr:hypothetical protein P8452_22652 [Trifolium repens]